MSDEFAAKAELAEPFDSDDGQGLDAHGRRLLANTSDADAYIDLAIDHSNLYLECSTELDASAEEDGTRQVGVPAHSDGAASVFTGRMKMVGFASLAASALIAIVAWNNLGSRSVTGPAGGTGVSSVQPGLSTKATAGDADPRGAWARPEAMPLTAVEPGGNLMARLNLNYDRLESEAYRPSADRTIDFETAESWPGDFIGRTALGLSLLSQVTDRPPQHLDEIWASYPQRMNSRGYFGPIMAEGCADEQQLASHGWVLRSLCEQYRTTGDAETLQLVRRIVENLVLPAAVMLEEYPATADERRRIGRDSGIASKGNATGWRLSTDDGCVLILWDGVVETLRVDPSPELLEASESFARLFQRLDLPEMQAQTHASLTGMRAALAHHDLVDDQSLLVSVREAFAAYKANAMTATYENYNWFGRPEVTEPCGVIDSYLVAMELWRLSGEPEFLEDAHHIYYNGFAATQRPNGGFGGNCCVGPEGEFLSIEVDESHWCCTMRGAEGLTRVAQHAYFVQGGDLLVTSYGTSSSDIRIDNYELRVSQDSIYPFVGSSRLTFDQVEGKGELRVRFFYPSYAGDIAVRRNGKILGGEARDGFYTVAFVPAVGDSVEVEFDFASGWSPTQGDQMAQKQTIRYGPLLLACLGTDSPNGFGATPSIKSIGGGAFLADDRHVLHALYSLSGPRVTRDRRAMRVLFDRNTEAN